MTGALIIAPSSAWQAPALFTPTPKAAQRRVYLNATRRFAARCDARGLHELAAVQPFHGASFIKELQGTFTPPTVKQHLTALRMLFDRLVTGHVMGANPAHAVRGPKYVVKKGKTPPGFCHYEEDEPRRPAPQRGDWATLPIAMPESLMVATDHTGG